MHVPCSRINRNIVECKVCKNSGSFPLSARINRNIVECKEVNLENEKATVLY